VGRLPPSTTLEDIVVLGDKLTPKIKMAGLAGWVLLIFYYFYFLS